MNAIRYLLMLGLFGSFSLSASDNFVFGFEDSNANRWSVYANEGYVAVDQISGSGFTPALPTALSFRKNGMHSEADAEILRLFLSAVKANGSVLKTLPIRDNLLLDLDNYYRHDCVEAFDATCGFAFPFGNYSPEDRLSAYTEVLENAIFNNLFVDNPLSQITMSNGDTIVTERLPEAAEKFLHAYEYSKDAYDLAGKPLLTILSNKKAMDHFKNFALIHDLSKYGTAAEVLKNFVTGLDLSKSYIQSGADIAQYLTIKAALSESGRLLQASTFLNNFANYMASNNHTSSDEMLILAARELAEKYGQEYQSIIDVLLSPDFRSQLSSLTFDTMTTLLGTFSGELTKYIVPRIKHSLKLTEKFGWFNDVAVAKGINVALSAFGSFDKLMSFTRNIWHLSSASITLSHALDQYVENSALFELDRYHAGDEWFLSFQSLSNEELTLYHQLSHSFSYQYYLAIIARVSPDIWSMLSSTANSLASVLTANAYGAFFSTFDVGSGVGQSIAYIIANATGTFQEAEASRQSIARSYANPVFMEKYWSGALTRLTAPPANYLVEAEITAGENSGNIRGKVSHLAGGAVDGFVTFSVEEQHYSARLVQDEYGYSFYKEIQLPGVAHSITLTFNARDGQTATASLHLPARQQPETDVPGENDPEVGTGLVFQRLAVNYRGSGYLILTGYVQDDLGNNVGGEIEFTLAGDFYQADLINSTSPYGGSFTIEVPQPYYTEIIDFVARSDNGLAGRGSIQITGTGEVSEGQGNIVITNPISSSKWQLGAFKYISFLANGIDPEENILFRLFDAEGNEIDKIGKEDADSNATDWRIPTNLPAGYYKIVAWLENNEEVRGDSSVFQLVSENTPPSAQDINLVAVSEQQITVDINAWDANDDLLSYAIAKAPSTENVASLRGNSLTYQAHADFVGVDTMSVSVSDGVDEVTMDIIINVIPAEALLDFTFSRSLTVSKDNKAISHVRTDGEFIYIMSDDEYLRKYDLTGNRVAEVFVDIQAGGLDVGDGYVALVSDAATPDIQIFKSYDHANDEHLKFLWKLTDIAQDNATDLSIGEGRAYISFQKDENNQIMYFLLSEDGHSDFDPSENGFSANGRYYHGGKDINALFFKRMALDDQDNIILFSGGDSEDLYQWREEEPQSNTGFEHSNKGWTEDILDIYVLGKNVYVAGDESSLAKFESTGGGITKIWSLVNAHDGKDVLGVAAFGADLFSIGENKKVRISSVTDGAEIQELTFDSIPKSLTVRNGALYVGLSTGELHIFTRNSAPIITGKDITTWSGLAQTTLVQISDLDEHDVHTARLMAEPQHGNVILGDIEDNQLLVTYHPQPGYFGVDNFELMISDGKDTASLMVQVNVKNRPPTASITLIDGDVAPTIGRVVTLNGRGLDPEQNTISGYRWSLLEVPPGSGSALSSTSSQQTSLTPDVTGIYVIGLTVSDGEQESITSNFELVVTNYAPEVESSSISASMNNQATSLVVVEDENILDEHTFTVVSQASHGMVEVTASGVVQYQPEENYLGQDSFTIGVTDSQGATTFININVVVENTVPVAFDKSVYVFRNQAVNDHLLGSDSNSQSLTYIISEEAKSGVFELANAHDGEFNYAPNTDFTGIDVVAYQVNDGLVDSQVAQLTINVIPATPNIYSTTVSVLSQSAANIAVQASGNGLETFVNILLGRNAANMSVAASHHLSVNDFEAHNLSFDLNELDCATEYFYQVNASNADGVVVGAHGAFTTSECVGFAPVVTAPEALTVLLPYSQYYDPENPESGCLASSDQRISAWLGQASATDLEDGTLEVFNNLPPLVCGLNNIIEFSAIDNDGNLSTVAVSISIDTVYVRWLGDFSFTVVTDNEAGVSSADEQIEDWLQSIQAISGDIELPISHNLPDVVPIGETSFNLFAETEKGVISAEQMASILVEYQDLDGPVLTVPGPLLIYINQPDGIARTKSLIADWLSSAVATDEKDGAVEVTHDAPEKFPVGVTSVTFMAKDSDNNLSIMSVDVTLVLDTSPPRIEFVAALEIETSDPEGVSRQDPLIREWLSKFYATDDNNSVVLSHNAPEHFSPGVTNITFSAVDIAGNTTEHQSSVTVEVIIPDDLNKGLHSYYPMEDSFQEMSNNGHDAEAFGNVTFGPIGAHFDGESYGRVEGFNLNREISAFTISLLLKPDELPALSRYAFAIHSGDIGFELAGDKFIGLSLQNDGSLLAEFASENGEMASLKYSAAGSIEAFKWYHVVLSRDAENAELRLHINGQPVPEDERDVYRHPGDVLSLENGILEIGAPNFYGFGDGWESTARNRAKWKGATDELRIYARSLAETEIAKLYQMDVTGVADSDGDGLADMEERVIGTEVDDADSDDDGLSDFEEIRIYNTDPLDPDTDDDGISDANDEFPLIPESQTESVVPFDFDGDARADISLRRPTSQVQYVKNSSGGNYNSDRKDGIQRIRFGNQVNDIPVAGDFDGDGIFDLAVRRPGNSYWYIKNSSGVDYISGHEDGLTRIKFGTRSEDIPVPGDYDGDGRTDIAVRRPSNQYWYIRNSSGIDAVTGFADGITRLRFGTEEEDIPVVADYDGDGKTDIAVRRPASQYWYILNSSGVDDISGFGDGVSRKRFGNHSEDIPVPADYDGDGKADLAVRRPSTQFWYILNSSGAISNSDQNDNIQRIRFGLHSEDIPIVADYDGDGLSDIAVRRASTYQHYILKSSDGDVSRVHFGKDGADIPFAAPIMIKMEMSGLIFDNKPALSERIENDG